MFSSGDLDGHERKGFLASLNIPRILVFADLTEKLLEIIIGEPFDFIFLDFGLVPFLQAKEMHQGT
jgi:hypothetical protein